MGAAPSQGRSPFVRGVVVDRDGAIAFLKRVGFRETLDPDTFVREDDRETAQSVAGARYTETVSLSALLSPEHRRAWQLFVRRWSRKLAGSPDGQVRPRDEVARLLRLRLQQALELAQELSTAPGEDPAELPDESLAMVQQIASALAAP